MKRILLIALFIISTLLSTGSSGWADISCKEPGEVVALRLAILSSNTVASATYTVKRNGSTVEQSATAMTSDGTNTFIASYTIPGSPTTFGDWAIVYTYTDGSFVATPSEYMPVKAARTCGTSGIAQVDINKIAGQTTAATNLESAYDGTTGYKDIKNVFVVTTGLASAGAASTITLVSPASTTAQAYQNMPVRIISGTGVGQARWITNYTTGRVATVDVPWVTTPSTDSEYVVDYAFASGAMATGTESGSAVSTTLKVYTALSDNTRRYMGMCLDATISSSTESSRIIGYGSDGGGAFFTVRGYGAAPTNATSLYVFRDGCF